MKFIYRLFWTMSIMSWMLFLYILKNIQSTGFEIACILVGFFVVVSPLICNILCKTSKSWLYQWVFWDSMCGSKMCIGDMLDFFDRLCYRYLNVILDEFCSIFCFAVSNRNDVFSSNADPSWLSFLRSPDEWGNLGENHPTRKNCTKCKIRGFW